MEHFLHPNLDATVQRVRERFFPQQIPAGQPLQERALNAPSWGYIDQIRLQWRVFREGPHDQSWTAMHYAVWYDDIEDLLRHLVQLNLEFDDHLEEAQIESSNNE